MQKILLAQAKAGMVLAREILTGDGRILCGKGTELSESLLSRLGRMDIASLTVAGHPVAEAGEMTLEEEIAAIERRFSKVTDIPPLMYLQKRLVHKLVQSRSTGTGKTAATSPPPEDHARQEEAEPHE